MKHNKKSKILIIEDEEILAEMYKDKFLEAGFDVFSVFNAEDGLILAKKEKPDLIILDIILPRENGISFLRKLREEKDIFSIPVVVLSNYDDPLTKKEAKQLKAKDYLIKTDFTPAQLIKRIKKYL